MSLFHLRIAALLLIAVLGACTPMRWERPATDATVAEADRSECNAIAQRQAQSFWPSPAYMPAFRTVRDRNGRTRSVPVFPWPGAGGFPPYGWGGSDQLSLQKDLFDRCMQAKGYRKVPVDEDRTEEAKAEPAPPAAATAPEPPAGLHELPLDADAPPPI